MGLLPCESLKTIHSSGVNWERLKVTKNEKCSKCKYIALCGEGCRYYPNEQKNLSYDERCVYGKIVPLCPIMKYNSKNNLLGGSSDDVMRS